MSIDELQVGELNESSIASKKKARIYFWVILWAIFPPILIFALLTAIIKPAIKGKEPNGINYVLWIVGLILLEGILELPFGSVSTISEALTKPEVCRSILLVDAFAVVFAILLIVLTFRGRIPGPYIPLQKFKINNKIFLLFLFSLLPLLSILSTKSPFHNPDNLVNPVLASLAGLLKNGDSFVLAIGLISVGFLGPLLEEIVFRGLLLESSLERERSQKMRFFLDAIVCLLFAVLHLPVSFVVPLILSAAFIYVRRQTNSLLPSMWMHISWNTSILISMIIALRGA